MSVYWRPTTLRDALNVMAAQRLPLTVLAGATDIYPARTAKHAAGLREPIDILDISAIPELRGVADRGDHWWIGATTTWSEFIATDLPPLFDGLKAAARAIGGVQIQNRGTIGGNICTASPAGDSIPCLLALDADVECLTKQPFSVAMGKFHTGYRTTILDGGLVTGLRIPKQPGRSHFAKLGARRYLVISIAMVCAVVDVDEGGRVRSAKVAVGACSATAQRLPLLEAALRGRQLSRDLVQQAHLACLAPIDDIRATAGYRRHAALTLVRDAIDALAGDTVREAVHG